MKVSLFDLDHTLLTCNSSFAFGSYLYKQNFFSTAACLKLLSFYSLHKAGFFSLEELHKKNFDQIFFQSCSTSVQQHVKAFIDQNLKKLMYLPVVQKLEQAKKQGHFTAILSNSPDFIVKEIAAHFGVDEWRATCYATDPEERFLNISCFCAGVDKANYIKNLYKRFRLEKENIIAYSDSLLDLPFLREAGHAVVVKPCKKLREIAFQNKWDIL